MTGFVPSNYKFVDPIRYFKENDPYYWEVDNIPLKQLQENCLWLKDQLELNVITEGVDREGFNELRPYVTGSDSVLRVKPGRFTARINDAYNKSPLQRLELISGTGIESITGATVNSTFQRSKYRSALGSQYAANLYAALQDYSTSAFNLNGLTERVLVWPYTEAGQIANNSVVVTNNTPTITAGFWPIISAYSFSNSISTENLQQLSVEFCRQFRGVARTAIVDVPEELTLTIPEFDAQDFYVIGSDGTPIYIPENQLEYRIDLAFIYSKPIDTSSSYIQQYSGASPREITKPILGIVKGAGVGLRNRVNAGQDTSPFVVNNLVAADGNTSIMAHAADKISITNGFQTTSINVHGSFPSPDDLMNLSPLISERLSETDSRLVGQTILPVAYIVVRKNPSYSAGVAVIPENDVLDIRPFFRTTELTYNERAGLAAAIPSPSLANPVATHYVVETAIKNIKTYVDARFEPRLDLIVRPIVIAGGVVQGGSQFGPEGILRGLNPSYDFGYDVSIYPTWDLAKWWEDSTVISRGALSIGAKGTQRTDWLDVIKPSTDTSELYGDTLTPQQGDWSSGDFQGFTRYSPRGSLCRKTIRVSKNSIPAGYSNLGINVNYKFCAPRAVTGQDDDRAHFQQFCGAYVEKYDDGDAIVFLIYSFTSTPSYTTGGVEYAPWIARNTDKLNSYIVQTKDMPRVLEKSGQGIPTPLGYSNLSFGGCTYPTIEFSIMGYPQGYFFNETRNSAIDSSDPMTIALPSPAES